MYLYRAWYLILSVVFASTMIQAKQASYLASNALQEVKMNSGKTTFRSKKLQAKYNTSQHKSLQYIVPIGGIFLAIIAGLVYWYFKRNRSKSPSDDHTNTHGTVTYEPSLDEEIDQTPVLLSADQRLKSWNISNYDIYQSTVIKENSIITNSNLVKRSYFSYASSEDVFDKLDTKRTLFVNSINQRLSFGVNQGANRFLAARIQERNNTPEFNELPNIEKWGEMEDANGNQWDQSSLEEVGDFVISYDPESELSIAHIWAPVATTIGHDQLQKGIEKLCQYAYYNAKYDSLILCAPGTRVVANGDPEIGNSAYRACIKGLENALTEIVQDPNNNLADNRFTFYLNWWDARVLEHVPGL